MSRTPFRRRSSEQPSPGVEAESESGQTLPEYAVLVAALAVGCVLAVVLLAAAIGGAFDTSGPSPSPGPFVPPRTTELAYPTKLEDCEHGRWRNYAQFRSEAECRRYVESHVK